MRFLGVFFANLNRIWVECCLGKTSQMAIIAPTKSLCLRNKHSSAIYAKWLPSEVSAIACSLEYSCSIAFARFLLQTQPQHLFFPLLQASWGRRVSKMNKSYLREQFLEKSKLMGYAYNRKKKKKKIKTRTFFSLKSVLLSKPIVQ